MEETLPEIVDSEPQTEVSGVSRGRGREFSPLARAPINFAPRLFVEVRERRDALSIESKRNEKRKRTEGNIESTLVKHI